MRNLILSSLTVLILNSCSLTSFKSYRVTQGIDTSEGSKYSWFTADTGRYLFRTSAKVLRNDFTGLLFMKPAVNSHRAIFITETGIKIFDIELTSDKVPEVHYCLEQINRRPLISAIGNDLSLMIFNIAENGKTKIMKDIRTGQILVRSKDNLGTRTCKVSDQTGKIDELIRHGIFSGKTIIRFYTKSANAPDSIDISHNNNKLNIHLIKIDENRTQTDE